MTLCIVLPLMCCLFFVGAVYAEEELKTLPDDPLYQAKRQTETAQLNAAFDPLEKATLHTKYAGERLAEVKTMASKGRHKFADDLLRNYETSIKGAMDEINRASGQGRDVSKALDAVERSTRKHTEVLTDLLSKVPEEARPAIKHAIEVSKHGRNTALDRPERIQRGEIPANAETSCRKPHNPLYPPLLRGNYCEHPLFLFPPLAKGGEGGFVSSDFIISYKYKEKFWGHHT